MNLEESNDFLEKMEKNNKNKKTVLIILVICIALIVILLLSIKYLNYQDSLKLKVYVDDTQISISSTLLVEENGIQYMNVRQLASILGYSYQKGEYKSYTEDENSCYLKNNYEILSMTADTDSVTKYIVNETNETETNNETEINTRISTNSQASSTTGTQTSIFDSIVINSTHETEQTFDLKEPIKYINNELYVPFSEMERLFNVTLNTSTENRIKMYSLKYWINAATTLAANLGYKEVSNIYENFTAIIDGMLVVGDGTNLGVVSLSTGKEIISLKYEEIVYTQNTKEFFVTAENSVGIVASNGSTIVKPTEYDSIATLDQLNKLYIVTKNNEYGVINGDGDEIVYPEFDSIGISNSVDFEDEDIRNFDLLFEECIPVSSNGKMGIIDINGEERLKCVYDTLGFVYTTTQTNKTSNTTNTTNNTNTTTNPEDAVSEDYGNVLTIPESIGIKGLVVKYNGLYGIYDVQAKRLIIPCACTKIYSKTKAGTKKYYLEYDEQEIELEAYLEEQNLKSVGTETEDSEEEISEETSEEIENIANELEKSELENQ